MGKHATKAGENIFTQARYNAAKFNDRLNSREGASEELGIDRSRLARIELGSKNPFPDEVLMIPMDGKLIQHLLNQFTGQRPETYPAAGGDHLDAAAGTERSSLHRSG